MFISRSSIGILVAAVAVIAAPRALFAQAPRETADVEFGETKVSLEYGCPPWSDSRRHQIDRALGVDGLWRLGADDRTTVLISGGAIRLGDVVVEAGGYGLNVRRLSEKEWNFVFYDGGEATASPEDSTWETSATFEEKKDASPERLAIAFVDDASRKALTVRFGPLALRAPIVPVDVKETELAFGDQKVVARWFSVKSEDAPRPGAWVRAGSTQSLFIGDADGAFDVDLKLDKEGAAVRFSNRGRSRVEGRMAGVERALAALKKAGGEPGADARRRALEEQKTKLGEELKDLGPVPNPIEVTVPLTPAGSAAAKIAAELVRRGKSLFVVVNAAGRVGEVAVDEVKLLPPPEKKEGEKK